MRLRSRIALTILTLLIAASTTGCGREDAQADRQRPKDPASERRGGPTTAGAPGPVGLGETAEVGPFAVTVNFAARRAAGGDRYAVVDLTLENRSQEPADASSADYLLRGEEGYSFEIGSAPDQRPRPEGRIEPGGKASGQVGFTLDGEPADGRLELSVTLPEQSGTRAARFAFEAEEEKEPEPKPEPEAAEKEDAPVPSAGPGYSVVQDPSGSLSLEIPTFWSSETGVDSEKEAEQNSWSYYAGEYLLASITTARSLEAWYEIPGSVEGSGAYVVASETLARDYTDDELIYSLLNQERETNCTAGQSREIDRPPYSGKIQAWFDCNDTGSNAHTFAAAPEGRPCVVVGSARVDQGASDADSEAVEHLIDTFEVDCGSLPTSAPLESSATASPEATSSASASQSAGVEFETASCDDFRTMSGEPSQYQAQQYYDFVATPEERAILDPDGDGFACEDLEPVAGASDGEEGDDASPEPDDGSPDPNSPSPDGSSTASPDPDGPESCDEVSGPIPTPPGDPNDLDADGDGQACE